MQRQWPQQPIQLEPERTPSMWMPQLTTTLHLTPLLQDQFVVPISLVFSANLGTILGRTVPTTVALTTTGQPLVTTNQFVGFKLVYTRLIGLVYLLGSNLALPATSYTKLHLVDHKSYTLLSFQPALSLSHQVFKFCTSVFRFH